MQLLSFDEVLVSLCDEFDSLISPKTISRSNTNIVYLILKAIAKGFEVINNICVVVSHKFDPANCSEEDLESVASIVGTEKYKGSASGLLIKVFNDSDLSTVITAGYYGYALDADTTFIFEVNEDTIIPSQNYVSFIAFSENVGTFEVTTQSSITVTSENSISPSLKFSCTENSSLLGTTEETNLEFRKRILTTTDRQDSIVELQNELKNQPYIFDARIKFNNSLTSYEVDGVTIPSYYMAIFYSGAPRNEMAELVCKKSVFPTVETEDSDTVYYNNEVFSSGSYAVHVIPFKNYNYKIRVDFTFNEVYTTKTKAENAIRQHLLTNMNTNVHSDYVKETDIYAVLDNLNVAGVEILNIDILDSEENEVPYISIPISRIPHLTEVVFPVVETQSDTEGE